MKKIKIHKISIRYLLCLLVLFAFANVNAQDDTGESSGGRYAGASMELGVGARALAIGGAATAMSGSADLFHYNPASLALIKNAAISLMYAPSFESFSSPLANYHYAGFAYPLPGGGTLALNWTRFAVDEIPIYPSPKGSSYADRNSDKSLQPTGEALGYFKDVEDVFYMSFAKNIKAYLPLGWLYEDAPIEIPFGMNFKVLRQKLYDASAAGLGIDIGAMIKADMAKIFDEKYLGDFAIGLSGLDVSQTAINWDTENETTDHVKRTYSLGMYYGQKLWFSDAVVNLYWTRRKKYDLNELYGMEFMLKGLALRLGRNEVGMTTGAGLQFWKLIVDYAFVSNELDDVHRVSCAFLLK